MFGMIGLMSAKAGLNDTQLFQSCFPITGFSPLPAFSPSSNCDFTSEVGQAFVLPRPLAVTWELVFYLTMSYRSYTLVPLCLVFPQLVCSRLSEIMFSFFQQLRGLLLTEGTSGSGRFRGSAAKLSRKWIVVFYFGSLRSLHRRTQTWTHQTGWTNNWNLLQFPSSVAL